MHRGEQLRLYFWRDVAGHEVDIIVDTGTDLIPVEIKSAQTVPADFFANLTYWRKLTEDEKGPLALIYGGDRSFKRSGTLTYPWHIL